MMALNSASSSAKEVSIKHAVRGSRLRTSRHTVTRSPAGGHVQHGNVGIEGMDAANGILGGAGLADHIDAPGLEQVA
jgi:hypothetical protein